ncbi:hypothetical protein SKAU_G00338060 [Synaphobranchus kaupii]|uniref:Uncharacterized protein n=1 Tax=Synaphobranchus kaupii TaxID=118154 RepID=A0A9Q1EMM8_SYNKA|nr:hypothetical protein SKAU_G00338060 [Synaphobranchus kaupii]
MPPTPHPHPQRLPLHLLWGASDPPFEAPSYLAQLSADPPPPPPPLGAPPLPGRDGARVPRRGASHRSAFGGLSAALTRAARTRCRRVSCFEGRHCGPLSCPWPRLNGPFDGRPEACHRAPCPGPERGFKAQNTWQKRRDTVQEDRGLGTGRCSGISTDVPRSLSVSREPRQGRRVQGSSSYLLICVSKADDGIISGGAGRKETTTGSSHHGGETLSFPHNWPVKCNSRLISMKRDGVWACTGWGFPPPVSSEEGPSLLSPTLATSPLPTPSACHRIVDATGGSGSTHFERAESGVAVDAERGGVSRKPTGGDRGARRWPGKEVSAPCKRVSISWLTLTCTQTRRSVPLSRGLIRGGAGDDSSHYRQSGATISLWKERSWRETPGVAGAGEARPAGRGPPPPTPAISSTPSRHVRGVSLRAAPHEKHRSCRTLRLIGANFAWRTSAPPAPSAARLTNVTIPPSDRKTSHERHFATKKSGDVERPAPPPVSAPLVSRHVALLRHLTCASRCLRDNVEIRVSVNRTAASEMLNPYNDGSEGTAGFSAQVHHRLPP